MLADGRCLFRAIAHSACLRSGEEAPDENRQRELADELRAQVSFIWIRKFNIPSSHMPTYLLPYN